MTENHKKSITQKAAKLSWEIPAYSVLIYIMILACSEGNIITAFCVTFPLILLIAGIIGAAGLTLGVIGCYDFKKYGVGTTLLPGIIGIILNGIILFVVVCVGIMFMLGFYGVFSWFSK